MDTVLAQANSEILSQLVTCQTKMQHSTQNLTVKKAFQVTAEHAVRHHLQYNPLV